LLLLLDVLLLNMLFLGDRHTAKAKRRGRRRRSGRPWKPTSQKTCWV
jgi:hypothetical protein